MVCLKINDLFGRNSSLKISFKEENHLPPSSEASGAKINDGVAKTFTKNRP